MENLLEDRVALVTGSASGLGRAIARLFASEGADLVVADVRETPREGGSPTHAMIEEETESKAVFVTCDVTRPSDLESAVARAAELGGLDVMVNNAGIFRGEALRDLSEENYRAEMDVNVKGTLFGSKIAARAMMERGGGSIINMSSTAGLFGVGDFITYCTSKGAVRLMTYALADALGPHGIRVNAIHPGVIESEMTRRDSEALGPERREHMMNKTPLQRFGQPRDVARVALFLASDLSSYVTATSQVVDGGMSNTG